MARKRRSSESDHKEPKKEAVEDAKEDVQKEEGMFYPTIVKPTFNVSIGVCRCDINEFIKLLNLQYEINLMVIIKVKIIDQ